MTTQGGTIMPATQFTDLGIKELRRAAVEDFAVEAKPTDNKETVLAALLEAGVTWDDYVSQHPEVAPEPVVEPAVVTTTTITEETHVEPVAVSVPRTAEPVPAKDSDTFLVKMTRENPLYETRGYRFTQQHPYAIVNARDLQYILEVEDGFRQAYPNELAEYYG